MWWRFGDHKEAHEAGDTFFVPGGHTSGADAGSEFVIFSPNEQMAPVDEHIRRRAEEPQSAARS
jgi:hypothetical protein